MIEYPLNWLLWPGLLIISLMFPFAEDTLLWRCAVVLTPLSWIIGWVVWVCITIARQNRNETRRLN